MSTFAEHLRALAPEALAALLGARPDLATPPPGTIRALAARASTRASVERALSEVDGTTLAMLEAVVALSGAPRPVDRPHPGGAAGPAGRVGPSVGDLSTALGLDTHAAVEHARRLGLVWGGSELRAAPGLADALGPHSAGLGPALVPSDDPDAPDVADRAVVDRLLEEAPPGAVAVLDALTWGPPVGRAPAEPGPARSAVVWLIRHRLLVRGDAHHVLLPREVALALRGGRTVAIPPKHPELVPVPVDARSLDAGAVQESLETVRLTAGVIAAWGANPPAVLRSGGLGARDLRRLALDLETTVERTALVVESAGAGGLLMDDADDPPSFVPTSAVDEWGALDVAEQWTRLAASWLDSDRAAWLVGTRDERGSLRGALDPASRRPWARRVRRAALGVLAGLDAPGRVGAEQVHAALTWQAPRSAPPLHAVQACLEEAELLGVLSSGALTTPGRALLHDDRSAATAAMERVVPPPVDEILLQGDLTGMVPGRPSAALAETIALTATVESRGAGLTVRFSEESVRRSLDHGWSAEDTLATLSRHARGGVPQPLEYLVLDTARRHGQVRAGAALSYVRAEPSALVGTVDDPTLRDLGLRQLAPGVLIAQVPAAELVARLRARGIPAVVEDTHGVVLHAVTAPRRVRPPRQRSAAEPDPGARARHLHRVAADLLGAETTSRAAGEDSSVNGGPSYPTRADRRSSADEGTAEPLEALATLREAVAERRTVILEIAGPDGPSRRTVRPLRVDGGRVRVVDAERETELTVAVHRIIRVTFEGDE